MHSPFNSTTFGVNHSSLCALVSYFWLSSTQQQNGSKTSQNPSRRRREHESDLSQSPPVVLLTSSEGDRSRPWCQSGVIRGGLGIWHGNHPWRDWRRSWMGLPGKQTSGPLCMPCCERDSNVDKSLTMLCVYPISLYLLEVIIWTEVFNQITTFHGYNTFVQNNILIIVV